MRRRLMNGRLLAGVGFCTLLALGAAGCGGGKGGGASLKDITRAREIATTRLTRTSLAVAGLGRKGITRAAGLPAFHGSRRAAFLLSAIAGGASRGRDPQLGFDHDTQLYYSL